MTEEAMNKPVWFRETTKGQTVCASRPGSESLCGSLSAGVTHNQSGLISDPPGRFQWRAAQRLASWAASPPNRRGKPIRSKIPWQLCPARASPMRCGRSPIRVQPALQAGFFILRFESRGCEPLAVFIHPDGVFILRVSVFSVVQIFILYQFIAESAVL